MTIWLKHYFSKNNTCSDPTKGALGIFTPKKSNSKKGSLHGNRENQA